MEVVLGENITWKDIVKVANGAKLKLSEKAKERMGKSRKIVENLYKKDEAIYGVTTGVGELASILLSQDEVKIFPKKLVYSHAAGSGKSLPQKTVRAAIAARLSALAQGYSGIRIEVVEFVMEMLNRGIIPVMYEASVGASGDLAPFAEAMLVPLGEGKAYYKDKLMSGEEALRLAGLEPIEYELKDGLALINGSSLIAGIACLAIDRGWNVIKNAEVSGALSFEALNAVVDQFKDEILFVRGFKGARESAAFIRDLLKGSSLYLKRDRVQDAYSIRSTPQVIGTVRDAIKYLESQVNIELNGGADNPLFIPGKGYFTGANFQGTPIALPLEMFNIGITTISVLVERRINRLVNPNLNNGLPAFLVAKPGLDSGIMVPQYTAAYFVNANRTLAYPSSTGSISTSSDQEDFVSMGTNTAMKSLEIINNTEQVIAIEYLAARQAVELRLKKENKRILGEGTKSVYQFLQKEIPFIKEDIPLSPYIRKLKRIVCSGDIIKSLDEK